MNSNLKKKLALGLTFLVSSLALYLVVVQMDLFSEPENLAFRPQDKKMASKKIGPISLQGNGFSGLAVGSDGSFWVADQGHIYRLDPEGAIKETISLSQQVYGLALGKNTIYGITKTGVLQLTPGPAKWKITPWKDLPGRPVLTSLCLSGNRLFVADGGNQQLHCFDLAGKRLWSISGNDGFVVPSPYFDVVADGEGGVWIANPGRHRIERYNRNGKYMALWKPISKNSFVGCCNPARMALLPGGRFVTLEKGLVRCRIFSPSGQVEKIVTQAKPFIAGGVYGCSGKFNFNLAVNARGDIFLLDGNQKKLIPFLNPLKSKKGEKP